MPADSLRPTIAYILAVRAIQLPRSLTIPGSFARREALELGADLLEWVDEREAVQIVGEQAERIAELESEVDAQAGKIGELERKLAAALKREASVRAKIVALKAAVTP